MRLKRQMFSRNYLHHSIMRYQYMTKLLSIDLLYDQWALVLIRVTCRNSVALCMGKNFIHIIGCFFPWNLYYTRKYALTDPSVNWQPIYFFKFFNCNTFSTFFIPLGIFALLNKHFFTLQWELFWKIRLLQFLIFKTLWLHVNF